MPAPTAFPKVYTVNGPSSTSSVSLPSWLTIKTRPTKSAHSNHKKRTKTQHQLGQLELVQDFSFPERAIKIKTTEDGQFAVGTGSYKPMMKVWDLEQLTVKFERVTDAENVDFVLLSSDWTKTLHLQRDRSLALHTQSGLHHSMRLPTYGRSLAYHSPSADALVGCTGTEIFRLNLEEGRYMTPLQVARNWGNGRESEVEGVNVVDVNPRHGLWSFGLDGGGGVIEFWDPRSRSALTRLTLPAADLLPVQSFNPDSLIAQPIPKLSITSLASHPTDGLSLAVGTSSGHTLLYDLRSPTPFAVKDQGYGEAVKSVDWMRGGGAQEDMGRVVSADSKVVKIWDKNNPSENHLSLHPPAPLNDMHAVPTTGVVFVACESAPMSAYYIPEIGPAPKWASFLDSVTEELADDLQGAGKGAYSDFKFVDKAELETLGLTHLIGTPTLKPYMHGYFLSLKLYSTARLIANPQSYADYRDRVVSERLAAKAESRIRAKREQPKVNKGLAERLRRAEEREEAAERKKAEKAGEAVPEPTTTGKKGGVLSDPRFNELFENPDFEVDEESREFAMLNPATANNNARRKTAVEDEEDESDRSSSDGLGDSESEEDAASGSDESDEGDLLQYDPRNYKPSERPSQGKSLSRIGTNANSRQPRLVIGGKEDGPSRGKSATFGQRLSSSTASRPNGKGKADETPEGVLAMRRSTDGGMEMSFIPDNNRPKDVDSDDEYSGGNKRRPSKVEKFGAGLERGQEEDSEEEGKGGRTRKRKVERSASKNVFRRM
ncbi:ribosome biogenesis protein ENP2, partial [Tremellales sp. Uapishka_1]